MHGMPPFFLSTTKVPGEFLFLVMSAILNGGWDCWTQFLKGPFLPNYRTYGKIAGFGVITQKPLIISEI
jgi:hypothetical protein